ncbi:MAG: hypothetical protein FH753_18625 [Firmicutes bacterium]|nr:hypothetical protein [Bacillota bacterium]
MLLRRRLFFITIAFICSIVVLLLGNKLEFDNEKGYNKLELEAKNVYHKYEEWEEKQLKENPDYDNLWILINIDSKTLFLIDLNKKEIIKKYIVAVGKPSTPTPIGNFIIIQKAKWGAGFGTRWMRLNVPWGKYGIHGTNKPNSIGYDASHGCVRMKNKDIEELYGTVKYKTPVTLIKGAFGPFGHGFRVIKPGDRGADVREVQKRLKRKGYYYGYLDGVYGDYMKKALLKFQKDNDMPVTDKIWYNTYKELGIFLME